MRGPTRVFKKVTFMIESEETTPLVYLFVEIELQQSTT